ncbi:2-oxo acid dehydrogenase subunit E2 [Sphingobium abikonense]|uniref:2-oxo acid dehydrogenase subunit E2 n=1 Tax=Sphingobium abikonense TaxID=86193 RepID=UPI003517FF85
MANLRAFAMPKWGIEMTEGVVAEWKVAQGQPFRKGDLLALIETAKITNEVEAEADGQFARLIAKEGETYEVGDLIAVLAAANDAPTDSEVDSFIASYKGGDARPSVKPQEAAPDAPPAPPAPVAASIPDGLNISPMARTFAQDHGVDVRQIEGTGPGGRITFQDVQQASLPPAPAPGGNPVDIRPVPEHPGDAFASPLARRLAAQHGLDLSGMSGTGPKGRICKADVLARVTPAPTASPAAESMPQSAPHRTEGVEIVRMSPMRKAIAQALSHSKSTIPHFYLRSKVRIDAILGLRAQAKAATGEAPSINDYIVRACALALKQHPQVNVQVHGDAIHQFTAADIAVAVATGKGLITPIVKGADQLSVAAISREVKRLADKARAGRLQPDEFQGGSFSVSNLGMYGIDQFDAIINPPQGAILAVGAGERTPVEIGNALAFATIVKLSLSCDHRAIDGAVGADFMRTLKGLIEEPALLTG